MKLTTVIIYIIILVNVNITHVGTQTQDQDRVYPRKIQNEALSDKEFQEIKNIVRRSELFRGNTESDFYYIIQVQDFKDNELDDTSSVKVNVSQNFENNTRNSLVQILSGNTQGNLILQQETSMWFYKPGTANPIRISPAQRFSGGASYSDVSSTNYTFYYDPIAMEEETIGNTPAYKISLRKTQFGVSYDNVSLFVSREAGNRPIKSEFYTRSGKLVKTMYFRKFQENTAFGTISTEWIIQDNLNETKYTVLSIESMGNEVLPPAKFTRTGLTQP